MQSTSLPTAKMSARRPLILQRSVPLSSSPTTPPLTPRLRTNNAARSRTGSNSTGRSSATGRSPVSSRSVGRQQKSALSLAKAQKEDPFHSSFTDEFMFSSSVELINNLVRRASQRRRVRRATPDLATRRAGVVEVKRMGFHRSEEVGIPYGYSARGPATVTERSSRSRDTVASWNSSGSSEK